MKKAIFLSLLIFCLGFSFSSGGEDQVDFPSIYIDGATGGVGSEADPYTNLSDVNWTTGGDNSIFDYLAGTPSESPTIYLDKAATWREQMTVGASGTATYPIVITAYGTGADPIINGADLVATWTAQTSQYQASVAAGSDDAWITETTSHIDHTTNYARLGVSGANTYSAPFRFLNLTIPQGSTIHSAYISVTAYSNQPGATTIRIQAQTDSLDAATFDDWADYSGRSWTTAYVDKALSDWTNDTDYLGSGETDETDIKTVIQEVISDGSWTSGYDTAIRITAAPTQNDYREASCQDFGEAAELTINYGYPNVWKATCTTEPNQVWFDGTLGTNAPNLASVDAENEWFWDSSILYVYYTEDPDGAVVIEAGAREKCIYMVHRSYITIDGLNLQHSNGAGGNQGGAISSNSYSSAVSNLIIQNCTISQNNWAGITILGYAGGESTSITIQDNTLSYCSLNQTASGGILTAFMDSSTIDDNTIHHDGEHAIRVRNSDSNIIQNNTCYTNGSSGITITDGADPGNHKPASNIVRYNVCHDNDTVDGAKANFELINSGGNNEFYYNLSYDSQTWGVRVDSGTTGDAWCNNVIYNSDDDNFIATDSTANITFKNNILHTCGDEHIRFNSGCTTGIDCDYNSYYPDGVARFDWGGSDYNFADWKTNSSQDANSINTDPLMTDPGSDDFTLQFGSPCMNRGAHVGLSLDYLGLPVPIGHQPDIGAYEHKNGGRVI